MTIWNILTRVVSLILGALLMLLAVTLFSTADLDHATQWILVLGFFAGMVVFFASLWSLFIDTDQL